MLNPFTGGSGPVGFYVSFFFLILSFVTSFALVLLSLVKRVWRPAMVVAILVVGLTYNVVMAEELLFGRFNGSLPQVLRLTAIFLKSSPTINKVITYNDIGAYELSKMGKYVGRFYATPQFEEGHKKRFAEHNKRSGHYLVVEIPLLFDGFYKDFFSQCQTLFETQSKRIISRVYGCKG